METEIEEQRKVADFIRNLEIESKELRKAQRAAGWFQRNTVYAHVNANYTLQEKVITSKNKWEQISFEGNVLEGVLNLLLPYRDLYGLYDISGMKEELESLLRLAVKRDEFEIAGLILNYQRRFQKAI